MGAFSIWHWIIVLIVVLILFGGKGMSHFMFSWCPLFSLWSRYFLALSMSGYI